MEKVNYDLALKRILKEAINEHINGNGGREYLSYTDLFYPKLETFLGLDGIMKIVDGNDVKDAFVEVGLDDEDYLAISRIFAYGFYEWNNNPTEERLEEIENISDKLLAGYVDKVRMHKITNRQDVNGFDEAVGTFFNNESRIFTGELEEKQRRIA